MALVSGSSERTLESLSVIYHLPTASEKKAAFASPNELFGDCCSPRFDHGELRRQFREENGLKPEKEPEMIIDLMGEGYNLFSTLRSLFWPRKPLKAPRLLFPIFFVVLPLVYLVTPFLLLMDTACQHTLGALITNGTVTLATDGPVSATTIGAFLLSGSLGVCGSTYTMLSWGGFITGYYGEPIRWISHSLYHVSTTHLLSNLFLLLLLVYYLEARYGFIQTFGVYLCGVVGAVLFSTWLLPPGIVLIGASGGIYGLVSMLFVDVWVNAHWVALPRLQLVATTCLLIVVGIQDVLGDPTVDSKGHWGGMVAGLGVSLLTLPRFVIRVPRRMYLRWWLIRIVLPYVVGGLLVLLQFVVLPSVLFGSAQ